MPWLSRALGASSTDAQSLKEAEEEMLEGPGALQGLGTSLTGAPGVQGMPPQLADLWPGARAL